MEIKNGYTGVYKNKHDKRKYCLSAQVIKKTLYYYFCCIDSKNKNAVPYSIELEYFLRLLKLGHFTKLKQDATHKKGN